jgi:hypothetical protein
VILIGQFFSKKSVFFSALWLEKAQTRALSVDFGSRILAVREITMFKKGLLGDEDLKKSL